MGDRSSKWNSPPPYYRALFNPESVAIIGASADRKKVGNAVLRNAKAAGFEGDIFPVNIGASSIEGLEAYASVKSLPRTPSLAVIVVPAQAVPGVMAECAEEGVRAAVVISAGFKETGIEGRRLEREMVAAAESGGVRVLGPNCLGIVNTRTRLNATFSSLQPLEGDTGFVSHSGAFCTSVLDWSRTVGVGFSKFISLGNCADLGESDMLEMLADDEDTVAVGMYLEGVKDGTRFKENVQRLSRKKPLIIIKAGTTGAGARAVTSHTGSLAGSEEAYEALFDQTPAIRAKTVESFFNLVQGFATGSLPGKEGTVILTNAGGPGIMAADAAERAGIRLANLSSDTQRMLRDDLPPACSVANPVDILGDADEDRYRLALVRILKDESVGSAVVIVTPQAMTPVDEVADILVEVSGTTEKMIMASFMGMESMREATLRLQRAMVPCYSYPDSAMDVLKDLYYYREQARRIRESPRRLVVDREAARRVLECHRKEESPYLDPVQCREVLTSYGIATPPFTLVQTAEEAVEVADDMGYPVALKVYSPQVLHKTDVGGVVLDCGGPDEVNEAFEDILINVRRHVSGVDIHGIAVQKMVPYGKEMIVGSVLDSQFGQMVMVGMGGIYVEVMRDISFRLAPLTEDDAGEMIRELKGYELLQGIRGEAKADIEAVQELLLRVSQLVTENACISEMDINPLMVYNAGEGYACVDARIALEV